VTFGKRKGGLQETWPEGISRRHCRAGSTRHTTWFIISATDWL